MRHAAWPSPVKACTGTTAPHQLAENRSAHSDPVAEMLDALTGSLTHKPGDLNTTTLFCSRGSSGWTPLTPQVEFFVKSVMDVSEAPDSGQDP